MKINLKHILSIVLLLSINRAIVAQNSIQTIIDDMTLPPDAALHGVPSNYSWANGDASPLPMPVPAQNWKSEWWQAITNWGQVYIPTQGSTAVNTRCQIREVKTYLLLTDSIWYEVQSSNSPQGAAFNEDFSNNGSIGSGIRDEAANGGGASVIVGVGNWTGHNFHFWSDGGRAVVNENTIKAVLTNCEARLIMDDVNLPNDIANCKNILQMGADWWLNTTTGWLPDWSANSGLGGGRSKWVTDSWQYFNFCTLTSAELISNPPPINGITTDINSKNKINNFINVYPNPSNSNAMVTYNVIDNAPISITLSDITGAIVTNIKEQAYLTKGNYSFMLNDLKTGIYILTIKNGNFVSHKKISIN
jgi:hypothetical protein